ncbi:MAG TPA: VC0807 family protein [Rhizomicrobium sp.]|nr:VC0807 family protein [Rhizomicrobium sp.]
MSGQTEPVARPFRIAMLLPTLVVDGVLPVAIFLALKHFGVFPAWALAIGCVPPALNNLRTWVISRQLDPLGILIMASIASGAVASVVSGNVSYRIVTDCVLNAGWCLAFLVSLLFARPVLFYLIREVVAAGDASRAESWNGLWQNAMFRSGLRSLTAIWSAVYGTEILIEIALAYTQTAATVVAIASIMNTGATLALIAFTHRRMKSIRIRYEREEERSWPL